MLCVYGDVCTETNQILINDRQQQLLFPPQPRLEVFKAL